MRQEAPRVARLLDYASPRRRQMANWRIIFFAINFAVSLGFAVLLATWIAPVLSGHYADFALFIGAVGAFPAVAIAIAEWLLFARRKKKLERPLGIIAGLVGAFALFAFIANAAEAAVTGGSPDALIWIGFGGICLGVAAYGFWCCWLRVRRKTLLERQDFPIDGSAAMHDPTR